MTRHPFRRVCRFAWARPTLSKPFTAHRARAAWRPFPRHRQPHPRDERVVIRRCRARAAVHDHVDQPFARMNPDPVQREHRVDGRERARRRRAPEPRDERLQRPAAHEPFVDVAEQDHRHRPVSKAASRLHLRAALARRQPEVGRDHAQRERAAIDVGVERRAVRASETTGRACVPRGSGSATAPRCRSGAPACRSSGRPPHAGRVAQVREHVGARVPPSGFLQRDHVRVEFVDHRRDPVGRAPATRRSRRGCCTSRSASRVRPARRPGRRR